MFQGTRSRGESLAKELQFLVGTIAGVFAGVLFSTVLHGHELLSMAAIVVAVFLAWQASLAAYAMMTFWITIILGLEFGLLGYFSPQVLLLRLKESVAGASCGILVAFVVMARPTRDFVDATITAFLGALAQAVGAAASLLLGQPANRRLPSALVEMESRLVDVRATAVTALQRLGIAHHAALRRRLLLLEACATWVINFSQISLDGLHLTEPTIVAAVQGLVHQIEQRVAQLTGREADAPPADVDRSIQVDSGSSASDVVSPLRLINLALMRMAETITTHESRPVAD
jgi:uncharacterized membrane protein YccC